MESLNTHNSNKLIILNFEKLSEKYFRKIVSNGWRYRDSIINNSKKIFEIESEHSRLQNYHAALKIVKETYYSHVAPSGKIYLEEIKNELMAIEKQAVKNENYELAYISFMYQKNI